MLVMSVVGTIPPTMIDAGTFDSYIGSIDFTSSMTDLSHQTVPYNTDFSQVPTFALLLTGFNFDLDGQKRAGFEINYGAITKSYAEFNINNSRNAANIAELNFRWVATVGEHLQLIPISHTFMSRYGDLAFFMAFDYKNKVVWSSGSFEVILAVALSAVHLSPYGNRYSANMQVAQWNGSSYTSNRDSALVLNVNDLYGTNRPFSDY